MDYIMTSFNEEQQKGYVVIQVSSTGLDEKEQCELRNEITTAIGKINKKRRHDNKPHLHFFESFNLK